MTSKEYFTKLYEMGTAGAVTQEAVMFLDLKDGLDIESNTKLRVAFKLMESEKNRQERLSLGGAIFFNLEDANGFMLYIDDIVRQLTSRWIALLGEVRLQQAKGIYTVSRNSDEYIALRKRLDSFCPYPKETVKLNSSQKQKYRDTKYLRMRLLDRIADLELERLSLTEIFF